MNDSEIQKCINSDDIVDNLALQIESNFEAENTSASEVKTPKKRRKLDKNNEFYEVTIPSMTLDDFRHHFRMSRSCFQSIMTRVANRIRVYNIEKKFLFTIWFLNTRESFYTVGKRFGVSQGPSHQYFCDIMDGLIVLFKEYVSWPSVSELEHLEQGFKPIKGAHVPGIVGAINSCHLLIKKPSRYSIYCNPKQTHSIILQAVCNHQKIFTDVYVGAPGSLGAERVYNNSPLSKLITEILPADFHIVGNLYYPLKQNLIVPFLEENVITDSQRLFNDYLIELNSTVDEAFLLLLARFHRLTYLDTANPEMANKIIVSCIILHNHILMTDLEEDLSILKEWPELYLNVDPNEVPASDDDPDGISKRDYLLSLFEYI